MMAPMRRKAIVTGALALVLGLAGCSSSSSHGATTATTAATTTTAAPGISVTSSVLREGQPIPVRYTCLGDGVSPPLQWSGVPKDAGSVAVVVDDPDAPSGTFVHWVLAALPPTQTSLPEAAPGFKPPCPPAGPPHHYHFSVYALRAAGPASPADIRAAAIASGTLTATFQR
jgi:phosphatidylethanolamine-binding protein (PEBP) family uncharacterized protein